MKQSSNSRKSFFYHWKLSQKLFLLFLAVGILPVTVIFGFTLYRIVQKNSEMMRYVMDKNFDCVEQMMDNIQERIIRIGSLITVSDEAGTALRMVEEESLIQELKKFDELSEYTYQLEFSSDDISILYYIPEEFLISESGNTCYRPMEDLKQWNIDVSDSPDTTQDYWRVIEEKNRYGQKKKYLANFRMIWNTEQYSQLLGVAGVMIPVDVVENNMSGLMDQQTMYLLNEENEILLSSDDKRTSPENQLSETGISLNTNTEGGEWIIRKNELNNGKMLLLSVVPRKVLAQGCGKIIREMLLFYLTICCLAYVLLRLGTRPFLMRIHKLDTTMEAVDQGILKPVETVEYGDELGKLIVRYNKMVQQIQCLMQEQFVLGKAKSEAELYALQTQISPHFLYNTLDMMNWMAVKGETDKIRSVLSSMSCFYRMVLSRGDYIITLEEEIRMCQSYMEIQMMRKKKKLQFLLDVDEQVYPYLIPKITLQPLLENAVCHGIDEKDGGNGTVKLSGYIEDDRIVLRIQDDGAGMNSESMKQIYAEDDRKHYGLKNVKTRLMIFYDNQAELLCDSAPGIGTVITLKIPKIERMEK
ncbi:sensor histidine kinase [Eubacterium ramulus]